MCASWIFDIAENNSAIDGMQTLQPFPLLSFPRFLMIQIALLPFLLHLFPKPKLQHSHSVAPSFPTLLHLFSVREWTLPFSHPQLVQVTSWGFLLGTILFSVMQAMQFYEGPSLVIHRLKRMQYVADIFFVLSGISMVDTVYAFLRRWFENYETYITYFYNKWVVFLLIAALLELYTTHRISHELKKENNQ